MNKKQLTVTWIALGVFALTLFNAPWNVQPPPLTSPNFVTGGQTSYSRSSYSTTAPVWDGPMSGELNIGALFVEWVGLGVVWGVLILMLKTKKPN